MGKRCREIEYRDVKVFSSDGVVHMVTGIFL